MPMLIWTISEYFYYKRKDLYFIKFDKNLTEEQRSQAKEELELWFENNLPDISKEPIFPFTADCGILSWPYDESFYIEFDQETLAKFCEKWENSEGKSLDERFQCYCIPLEDYIKRYNGEIPDPKLMWDEYS